MWRGMWRGALERVSDVHDADRGDDLESSVVPHEPLQAEPGADVEIVLLAEEPAAVHVEPGAEIGPGIERGDPRLEPERPPFEGGGGDVGIEAPEAVEVAVRIMVGGPDRPSHP